MYDPKFPLVFVSEAESRRHFSFGAGAMMTSKLQRKISRQMTISGDSAASAGKSLEMASGGKSLDRWPFWGACSYLRWYGKYLDKGPF